MKKHFTLKISALFCALFCAFSLFTGNVYAERTADTNSGVIRVGLIKYGRYCYTDSNGDIRGYDAEYAHIIAQYAHMNTKFVVYDSINDATDALRNDFIDLIMDFGKNENRENEFLFSDYNISTDISSIYVRKTDNRYIYGDVTNIKNMKLGVIVNTSAYDEFEKYCEKIGITPDVQQFPSFSELQNALTGGKIDGAITGSKISSDYRIFLYFAPVNSYIMYNKNNTDLKNKLDAAMGQIVAVDPLLQSRLYEKYLAPDFGVDFDFTSEEKDYIAKNSAFKVAIVNNDPPYFFYKDGKPSGIIVDYFNVLSERTTIKFEYMPFSKVTDAMEAVKNGIADIVGLCGNDSLSASKQGLILTTAYADLDYVEVTRRGYSGTVKNAAVTEERCVGAVQPQNVSGLGNVLMHFYNNSEECYNAVMDKKEDAMLCSFPTATWLTDKYGVYKIKIRALNDNSFGLNGAVEKNNYMLCSVLDKAIIGSTSHMQRIIAEYSEADNKNLSSFVSGIPPVFIVIFVLIMIALVLGLLFALILLRRRQTRYKNTNEVKAETTEQKEKVHLKELAKKEQEKNEIFSNISHDMRTPLNAIIGFSDLAGREEVSPQVYDYLSKINTSGKKMLSLVNDTLTVSRINNGKVGLHPEPVDMHSLLNTVIKQIRPLADAKNILFTVDNSGTLPRNIVTDKNSLMKILQNLLENAVKFTPKGGQVELVAYNVPKDSQTPDSVIEVRDNGIGMSEDFLEHVFEPFSQERRSGYESTGTGLGLAIVRKLVDMLGGSINVKSEKDKGTVFTVRLHFNALQPSDGTHGEKSAASTDLRGRKVLLFEDNELNSELACSLLAEKGIETVTAENGKEGVNIFSASGTGEFSAVLMDIRMPIMNGYEATARIRSMNRPDASLPIIAMTADTFAEDVEKCLAAGMNGHVAKPVDPIDLFDALSKAIAEYE